jgi:CrcB protein
VSRSRLSSLDLLLVALGGAAGALLRHAIDSTTGDSPFPWPTLVINVVGAFASLA